jgi:hypothetical protein
MFANNSDNNREFSKTATAGAAAAVDLGSSCGALSGLLEFTVESEQ